MSARRVLVVDDDQAVVQMLTSLLRKEGYDVMAAADALQAVMRAHRDKPDVILLDIMMPAGGGFSVLERLKASVHTSMIPVIVLTGSVEAGIEEKARAFGIQGFFHKPCDILALFDCIRQAVGEGPQAT
jgi:CheY-like chemotaxis protein